MKNVKKNTLSTLGVGVWITASSFEAAENEHHCSFENIEDKSDRKNAVYLGKKRPELVIISKKNGKIVVKKYFSCNHFKILYKLMKKAELTA